MTVRLTEPAHALCMGVLAMTCVGAAFMLIHEKPTYGWLAPFAIGSGWMLYAINALLQSVLARQWARVIAVILSASVREVHVPGELGGYMAFVPQVSFRFEYQGEWKTSDQFSLRSHDFQGSLAQAQAAVAKLLPGVKVAAFLTPGRMVSALLRIDLPWRRFSHYLACLVGGMLLTVISIWIYVLV